MFLTVAVLTSAVLLLMCSAGAVVQALAASGARVSKRRLRSGPSTHLVAMAVDTTPMLVVAGSTCLRAWWMRQLLMAQLCLWE